MLINNVANKQGRTCQSAQCIHLSRGLCERAICIPACRPSRQQKAGQVQSRQPERKFVMHPVHKRTSWVGFAPSGSENASCPKSVLCGSLQATIAQLDNPFESNVTLCNSLGSINQSRVTKDGNGDTRLIIVIQLRTTAPRDIERARGRWSKQGLSSSSSSPLSLHEARWCNRRWC